MLQLFSASTSSKPGWKFVKLGDFCTQEVVVDYDVVYVFNLLEVDKYTYIIYDIWFYDMYKMNDYSNIICVVYM